MFPVEPIGGDDYELLFTAPSEILEQMSSDSFTNIGVVTKRMS